MSHPPATSLPAEAPAEPEAPEAPNPKRMRPNALDVVDAGLQGMESSFSTLHTTLANSLQRTVEMSLTMSKLLEHMFKSNISLASRLEPKVQQPGTLQLTLTISNGTPYPVSNVSAQLVFQPIQRQDRPTNKKDTGYPVEYSFQSATTTHLEHQTVDTAKSIFTENSTLPVTTSHTELLSLQITTPGQYNGTLLLSFPSPGTHEPITLVHTFGLYLLDQLTKTVLPQDTPWKRPTPPLISRDYAVDFLRQMLSIHPRLGMQQGMQVQLASPKARVVCLFQSFTEETPTVHAVFYGEEELLSLVIMELDTLSAVKRP